MKKEFLGDSYDAVKRLWQETLLEWALGDLACTKGMTQAANHAVSANQLAAKAKHMPLPGFSSAECAIVRPLEFEGFGVMSPKRSNS